MESIEPYESTRQDKDHHQDTKIEQGFPEEIIARNGSEDCG